MGGNENGNERSAKRQKMRGRGGGGGGGKGKGGDKSKYRAQGHGNISASGLQSGDVGIFVTCDKGKEKACLREIEDLLSDELGLNDEVVEKESQSVDAKDKDENESTRETPAKGERGGIEDDIQRELAELAGEGVMGGKRKRSALSGQNGAADSNKRKLGLVTLDIPCVSFVRFPTEITHDPVDVATKLCRDAREHPERQRSRFIKRLTPLKKVRKVMSGGVEELCQDVLPPVFSGEDGWKYAVRVTVRNNNQIEKDQVIKTVASAVRELGLSKEDDAESKHRVDLKGYDKLVLVEIYRNVVGMAIVGAEWESLRRFNLSEIYGEARATAVAEQPARASQVSSEKTAVEDAPTSLVPEDNVTGSQGP